MNEEREPDERHEPDEVDLGEPTESAIGLGALADRDSVPDAAELEERVSETRKPMGPPLDEPEERAETGDDDEPRSPPIDLTGLP